MSKRKAFKVLDNNHNEFRNVKKRKILPPSGPVVNVSYLFKLPYEILEMVYKQLAPCQLILFQNAYPELTISIGHMKCWRDLYLGSNLTNHRTKGEYSSFLNCLLKEINFLCDCCFKKWSKAGSQAALFVQHKSLVLPRMKLCVGCRVNLYEKYPEPTHAGFQSLIITRTRAQQIFKLGDCLMDMVPDKTIKNSFNRGSSSLYTCDNLLRAGRLKHGGDIGIAAASEELQRLWLWNAQTDQNHHHH
ncbi:hypothetical protein BDA99DRAFT_286830 [Phascolomyces articulosus]|uniref:F-box domain-containing protein n=1 Tax=Phascolomyces articulosus TaxID=60185 RepID=A0AAD5P7Z7_9FUNG|nr:hypothetical protein BDA99DRAFT_286830 [Phascolomyces articulosus]